MTKLVWDERLKRYVHECEQQANLGGSVGDFQEVQYFKLLEAKPKPRVDYEKSGVCVIKNGYGHRIMLPKDVGVYMKPVE